MTESNKGNDVQNLHGHIRIKIDQLIYKPCKTLMYVQQKLMEVNYLGSVYPTRAVITTMKERRMGRIMFVSSQAGQIGLFGYTAYSPSKFALRGLAESLQMEVSFPALQLNMVFAQISKVIFANTLHQILSASA